MAGIVESSTDPGLSVDLLPLGILTARLADLVVLEGTPSGMRVIADVVEARLEGERINASAKGVGADWLIIGPDGTDMLDARFTLLTDDGALIYVQFHGRSDVREGVGAAPVYAAPRFETGDDRYAWLNRIQAIAKGRYDPGANTITYAWYEMR
jgi:uncharacterized protein DUF3237